MTCVTLKIQLVGARPPVWRVIRVPLDLPLPALHEIIQIVMGWEGYHLHGFARGKGFWQADERWLPEPDGHSDHVERDATLHTLLGARRQNLTYMYDFGDDWEHHLTVQSRDKEDTPDVELLRGEGGVPTEDCGGVGGLAQLIDNVKQLAAGKQLSEDELEWTEAMAVTDEPTEILRELTEFDLVGTRADLAEQFDLEQWENWAEMEDRLPGLDETVAQLLGNVPDNIVDAFEDDDASVDGDQVPDTRDPDPPSTPTAQ